MDGVCGRRRRRRRLHSWRVTACCSVLLTLAATSAVLTCNGQRVLSTPSDGNDAKASVKKQHAVRLPACGACSLLAESFGKSMTKTEKGNLGGGDTDWEEHNQRGGYRRSEIRLTEIQDDHLCADVVRGHHQCVENAGHWAEHIEEWWSEFWSVEDDALLPDAGTSVRNWLCVERLKHCCPYNTFGPECKECAGRSQTDDRVFCSGRGVCRGNGTRVGDGRCRCQLGYTGPECHTCDDSFYESYRDEAKVVQCSPCHKSCQQSCTGPGPQACLVCRQGYTMHSEHGCLDVDECTHRSSDSRSGVKGAACADNQFCVNTEGSYRCVRCDRACKSGCDGDGPDACFECADGYVRAKANEPSDGDDSSADKDAAFGLRTPCVSESVSQSPLGHMSPVAVSKARFVTYAGLVIATVIIFLHRSVRTAAVLGAFIAAYIALSEYYLLVHTVTD